MITLSACDALAYLRQLREAAPENGRTPDAAPELPTNAPIITALPEDRHAKDDWNWEQWASKLGADDQFRGRGTTFVQVTNITEPPNRRLLRQILPYNNRRRTVFFYCILPQTWIKAGQQADDGNPSFSIATVMNGMTGPYTEQVLGEIVHLPWFIACGSTQGNPIIQCWEEIWIWS